MRKASGAATSAGSDTKRAGANEVKRRQKPEVSVRRRRTSAWSLPDRAGEHHPEEVSRQHRLAVGPGRQRAQTEQAGQQQVLGFQLRRPAAEAPKEPRREPWQDVESHGTDADEHQGLVREWRKDQPSATTVARSVMKQAASTLLP